MNKYGLITEFFSSGPEAVKFFVQLKALKIANNDKSCIATLEKTSSDKWTYILEWENGQFGGEELVPFKPSIENVTKFNKGTAGLAVLLERFIDTQDLASIEGEPSPFGDMVYKQLD